MAVVIPHEMGRRVHPCQGDSDSGVRERAAAEAPSSVAPCWGLAASWPVCTRMRGPEGPLTRDMGPAFDGSLKDGRSEKGHGLQAASVPSSSCLPARNGQAVASPRVISLSLSR